MRHKKAIILAAAGVLLLGGGAAGLRQQAQPAAPQEIQAALQDRQQVEEALRAAADFPMRELTEEERQALQNGEATVEQLAQLLAEGSAQEAPVQTGQPETATPENNGPEPGAGQKEWEAALARIYVLRESYTMELERMEAAAKAEYHALPENKRGVWTLSRLAAKYLAQAQKLEQDCDRQMDAAVAELEQIVRETGGDTELPQAVRRAYQEEKRLKKAEYLKKLKEKGLG